MLNILKGGLYTTVQDLGRTGFRRFGVSTAGAMDTFSLRIANLLVGNREQDAALEATLVGPDILFTRSSAIAVCGGDLSPTLNSYPVPMWSPVTVENGDILRFEAVHAGCRAYIAIAGGISIPRVMDSASTFAPAKIGGFHGRPLERGDCLETGTSPFNEGQQHPRWHVSSLARPDYGASTVIRVLEGRHFHLFDDSSRQRLFAEPYRITAEANRMGYRLEGPALLLDRAEEIMSEAVTFGTVQVPSGGQPIVLMADCQTTGGYPKIAQVAAADLPLLGQLKPGDSFQFRLIGIEEAQRAWREQEQLIKCIKHGIRLKTGGETSETNSGFEL